MTIAAGVDARTASGPNSMNATRMPRPGPGFVSIMNRIDLPSASDCAAPSGVNTPWLMALLRNSTLPGSTKIDASGSSRLSTRKLTPDSAQSIRFRITGPIV